MAEKLLFNFFDLCSEGKCSFRLTVLIVRKKKERLAVLEAKTPLLRRTKNKRIFEYKKYI